MKQIKIENNFYWFCISEKEKQGLKLMLTIPTNATRSLPLLGSENVYKVPLLCDIHYHHLLDQKKKTHQGFWFEPHCWHFILSPSVILNEGDE